MEVLALFAKMLVDSMAKNIDIKNNNNKLVVK
jgi:hypothetical protein